MDWSRFILIAWLNLCLLPNALFAASKAVHEEVFRTTLSNGLQVIIVKDPLAPVVTTMVNYRVGSDEAPPGFPGTAHALEHMMFRGSPGLSASQLAALSAALGGEDNADTQQMVTQYFFTVPSQDVGTALHIEAVRMKGLLTDTNLWEHERGAIEQEVAQDLSNPEYVFYMKLLEMVFKGTPYEHDALGTRPSFDKTTSAMLQQFHNTWYAPNSAILIIVGNVQTEATLQQVKELFGKIPAKKLPPRPRFKFQPVKPETIRLETDLPNGRAIFAFRMPGSDSPDYAATQILSDVLSSKRGDLFGLVPEGKALAASFDYESLPKAGLGFAAAEFPAGGDAERLLQQMREILKQAAQHGVSADLVEAAKRWELLSEELERNSITGLATEWSEAVAIEGRTSPQEDIEAIRRVTTADVNRVAKKYLDLNHAITAILTPKPSGKPVSPKGFGGAESFTPTHTEKVELPPWAEQAARRLEVPRSTLSPVVSYLPNGVRLIVQPVSISDTVSIFGRVKNHSKVQEPAGREGVASALSELFDFGTTKLDRLAFQTALDEIGAIETAGVDFSLQVLASNFDRGTRLLAENMISPALPEPAFKILQPELAAAVAGELESPGYLANRALEQTLFPPDDPVQREATPATVKSLTIQDVRNYYEHAFRPDLTTIVVIGNVAPKQVAAVVSKYFGSWKNVGPKPNTLFPPAPNNSPAVRDVPDASRTQDKVMLGQTLKLVRTNDDYYALELGNHVLGGGFYATRLYRDLRENNGLVYFVSSKFQVGETRGVYLVDYACDPPNVGRARAIVETNLRQMQQTNVTAPELDQARALLLREIPLSESSTERIAKAWLQRAELGLPLDEDVRAAQRYVDLSAEAVRAAFAKWLRPNDLVQVTQGPTP